MNEIIESKSKLLLEMTVMNGHGTSAFIFRVHTWASPTAESDNE